MLGLLNDGRSIDPKELAQEFGVSVRTIQRDLNERFCHLDLEKRDGRYHLDPASLGRLQAGDLARFATIAGVRDLFPDMGSDFLRDIFDSRTGSSLSVKGHDYENLASKQLTFRELTRAISDNKLISFDYASRNGARRHLDVHPYKLINSKGIWYLAGSDAEKLKTFAFSRIEKVLISDRTFVPDAQVASKIGTSDGIWFNEHPIEVMLKVDARVASYFKRRTLIAHQKIEREHPDGSLVVSTKAGHPNQILPIIRYWIPNVSIISPESLKLEIRDSLLSYIQSISLPNDADR